MLGDTIDIKKDEKRYNQLLGEGILPSAAIRKIENEKRLGIVVDTGFGGWGLGEISFGKIAVAGVVLFLGYYILKGKPSGIVSSSGLMSLTIDNIVGIDLVALKECRQNGLM